MKAKWILVLFMLLLIGYLYFGCTGNGDGSDEGVPTHTSKAVVFIDTDLDSGQLEGTAVIHRADDGSDITWHKTYGGSSNDSGQCFYQTKDGSFIIAGNSSSFATASQDWWLLKILSDGTLDCGMGDDSISSSDTTVTDGDTAATVGTHTRSVLDTSVTADDTVITGTDTSATVRTQCSN